MTSKMTLFCHRFWPRFWPPFWPFFWPHFAQLGVPFLTPNWARMVKSVKNTWENDHVRCPLGKTTRIPGGSPFRPFWSQTDILAQKTAPPKNMHFVSFYWGKSDFEQYSGPLLPHFWTRKGCQKGSTGWCQTMSFLSCFLHIWSPGDPDFEHPWLKNTFFYKNRIPLKSVILLREKLLWDLFWTSFSHLLTPKGVPKRP